MDTDEVRTDHIPVNVLQRQMKIVVGAQLLLQQLGEPRSLLVGQARNSELRHQFLPEFVDCHFSGWLPDDPVLNHERQLPAPLVSYSERISCTGSRAPRRGS